ncbi:MAG: hypothetical protein IPM63_06325 [Acidobacteriota bacterium]|nr:MAG: hypothetical protein IPM63_06325 [Acidobacteriota bacterium]
MDRYFFQIVPPILLDEILADLTKGLSNANQKKIAAHTYRVCGNHGHAFDARERLENSLLGNEIPMDSRFTPANETVVVTANGSFAIIVESPFLDETLDRWQSGDFEEEEQKRATRFRAHMERPLNVNLYVNNIVKAGLTVAKPDSVEDLVSLVDDLLYDRKLLPRLFAILAQDFGIKLGPGNDVVNRWYEEGQKAFDEFAPFAFFCLRASFLWHLSLLNPSLFKSDKKLNDRKDLEYCFYLPNCQVFCTNDEKQRVLMSFLLRQNQSLVSGSELKEDLSKIAQNWDALSMEKKIAQNANRGMAPPEDEDSLVFRLWKKHDGILAPSKHKDFEDRKLVDGSLPEIERKEFTMKDFAKRKIGEIQNGRRLSPQELADLHDDQANRDPFTMRLFNRTINSERLRKWHPELPENEIAELKSELENQLWMDPSEYEEILIV